MENEYLLEYKGETYSDKLKNKISKHYFEEYDRLFPKKDTKLKEVANFNKSLAQIVITDPNETEIKQIGMSCMNDLLLDNWGKTMLALLFGGVPTMKNLTNVDRGMTAYGNSNFMTQALTGAPTSPLGTLVQVGSGSTPPVGSNFNIETALASSPESTRRNTGNGGWNSGLGQVQFGAVISPTGGIGIISEACFYGQWYSNTLGDEDRFCLSRDLISPVVPFGAGEAININYVLALS